MNFAISPRLNHETSTMLREARPENLVLVVFLRQAKMEYKSGYSRISVPRPSDRTTVNSRASEYEHDACVHRKQHIIMHCAKVFTQNKNHI